eukprot:PLAT7429.1.p2 GENE.PLAT7429.1~~PLAT7429.1.p2  ORF type:complete len:251 (-),score=98.31 PLAT7429.1:93-797(-)
MMEAPSKRTLRPIVTGTSVVAIKYADGVLMAADTLGSYGSLARFKDLRRIRPVASKTLLGGGGDYSDFQAVVDILDEKATEDFCVDDGSDMTPSAVHSYLTRILYARRNKFNPLWAALVVAGVEDGKPFLGITDLIGTAYEENYIATGYGAYIALPLIRKAWREDMSEEEARELLLNCMRVLFYRDCRTINRIQLAKVTDEGTFMEDEPVELETKWDYPAFVHPKSGADTGGSW